MSTNPMELSEEFTINTRAVADLMNLLSNGIKVVNAIEDDAEREHALRFMLGLTNEWEETDGSN